MPVLACRLGEYAHALHTRRLIRRPVRVAASLRTEVKQAGSLPRLANSVVGAGTAGLAAAQARAARGLDFVVFEAGSRLGGNWRWDNDSGLSSGYRSLMSVGGHMPLSDR